MAEAESTALAALETWAVESARPRSEWSHAELLSEATRQGLELTCDTIAMVREALADDKGEVDLKLLRLGNDAAQAAARLSMRAAEGEFRARKSDALERLLTQLAQENQKLASKKG